ncbi:YfiT family bacillithiol transferase [Terriglobus sp. RCC_193]|uniref:YfiT family bacillithiol transferase n=1 Tax=Terriglobus sp. RCC_193 TaxID=3239218 RepID=UPI00352497DB
MTTDNQTQPSSDPRYPVGRFHKPSVVDTVAINNGRKTLEELPQQLRNAVANLNDAQLATPYREGGWTLRQTVHHIADSHMNAYIRMKLALTEDAPVIRTYEEALWAELQDGKNAPVEWSLQLIEALHARWVMMLRSLNDEQWQRTFVHPEHGPLTLQTAVLMYDWHSRHHLAHITSLRHAKGW